MAEDYKARIYRQISEENREIARKTRTEVSADIVEQIAQVAASEWNRNHRRETLQAMAENVAGVVTSCSFDTSVRLALLFFRFMGRD